MDRFIKMNRGQFTVIEGLNTLARINHNTKEVEVRPDFLYLSSLLQELIIIQLNLIAKHSGKFKSEDDVTEKVKAADLESFYEMYRRHPHIDLYSLTSEYFDSLPCPDNIPAAKRLNRARMQHLLDWYSKNLK